MPPLALTKKLPLSMSVRLGSVKATPVTDQVVSMALVTPLKSAAAPLRSLSTTVAFWPLLRENL